MEWDAQNQKEKHKADISVTLETVVRQCYWFFFVQEEEWLNAPGFQAQPSLTLALLLLDDVDCHSNPISHKRSLPRQARPRAIQERSESKLEMVCTEKGGRKKKQNEGEQNGALVSLLNFPPLAKLLAGLSSRTLQGTLKQGSETQENKWGPSPDLTQISQAQFGNMNGNCTEGAWNKWSQFIVFFFYSWNAQENTGFCFSEKLLLKWERKKEKRGKIGHPRAKHDPCCCLCLCAFSTCTEWSRITH